MKEILSLVTSLVVFFAFVAAGVAGTEAKPESKTKAEARAEPTARTDTKAKEKGIWDTKCAKCHKDKDKKKSKAALLEKYKTGDDLIKAIKESQVPAKAQIKKDESLLTALTKELYPEKKTEPRAAAPEKKGQKKGAEKASQEPAKTPPKKKIEGC